MHLDMDIGQALQQGLDRITGWVEGLVANLPNIIGALLILLLAWGVARVVGATVARLLRRFSVYPDVNRVAAWLAYSAVLALGLFVALGVLDLDRTVTSLLAGAGIIGLALGFAFQDIAENFISGIILSVRRQFTDGDIIETNEIMGIVERVNMRATVVRTFTGQRVLIPNSQVYKNPLTNYSTYRARRVDIAVGVAYGDDLEEAKRVAIAAVECMDARDDAREVELFYEEFGDSSINFQLRFWIDFRKQTDFLAARSEAIVRIKRAFDENDITIPFPIRTLDFGIVGGVPLSKELAARGAGNGG